MLDSLYLHIRLIIYYTFILLIGLIISCSIFIGVRTAREVSLPWEQEHEKGYFGVRISNLEYIQNNMQCLWYFEIY